MSRLKIIVSDSSVLMDLAKVDLLEATVALPFDFMIPDVMLAEELLDLGRYRAAELVALGFRSGSLNGPDVARVFAYFREQRRHLSLNDCFAWRLAELHEAVLMTGDGDLRRLAKQSGVEVHGLLWVIGLMATHATCVPQLLLQSLDRLDADVLVRVPRLQLRMLRNKLSGRS